MNKIINLLHNVMENILNNFNYYPLLYQKKKKKTLTITYIFLRKRGELIQNI